MIRPPQLCIHHVGIDGFDTDAPKTLYHTKDIDMFCSALEDDLREQTRATLHRLFPSGHCHCWGVPEKAPVLGNLAPGDYVLLMRTTRIGGEIPILCWVKYVLPTESPELSKVLWGKDKFPLIFMFDSELISLTWDEFRLHMGYSERYDPRGRFLTVAPKKLIEQYGGAKGYIAFVRKNYAVGALRLPQRHVDVGEIIAQGAGDDQVRVPDAHPQSDYPDMPRNGGPHAEHPLAKASSRLSHAERTA